MESPGVIRDLRVLTEEFIPSRILHRDSQLGSLKSCIEPLISGGSPRNCFLYGPPGTGKTSLSIHVSEELKKQAAVSVCYVNCWETSTKHGILYSLLKGLGVFAQRKGVPTDELLEDFLRRSGERKCLVILDEVDMLEDSELLYNLVQAGMGLLMLSNSDTALYSADPRVRSRLAACERVEFHRYTERELADIIRDRKEWGLVPGSLGEPCIEGIASLANGDARVALSILSAAAQKAEDRELGKIPISVVEESVPKAVSDSLSRVLEGLSPHQRLAVEVLREGPKGSGELFESVRKRAVREGLESVVDRTLRKHMERLVRHGLARAEGGGRWRTYSLASRR